MAKGIVSVGRTFFRWTVLSYQGKGYWLCRCECGTTRPVYRSSLMKGSSKSCGCWNREATRKRSVTHGCASVYGGTLTPEYQVWLRMKARCYIPSSKSYRNYGARGIVVCDRWRDSFEAFLQDMGKRPSPQHSIERIDNNGPYSPENCRWATRIEQGGNKRNNRLLTFRGETACLAEWARRCGLGEPTLLNRIRAGWDLEKALTTPPRSKNGQNHFRNLA